MTLAVASGKGGTGKTTVAVNLALTLRQPVQFLDCDVEEPNAHLFLRPEIREREAVRVPVPWVDEERCTSCGECGQICQHHAIVSLRTKPLVFPELCHGCGGCALVCPTGAITEAPREVGVIDRGPRDSVWFAQGRLKVGEAMAVPVIRALKRSAERGLLTIIDAPPGTSCPVVASVRGSDFVVLVTEPTPFGLNDLVLAVGMVRALELPFGVVINRSDIGDDEVLEYCEAEAIPLLLQIPENRRLAEAYSRGEPAVEALPELRPSFETLYERILAEAAKPRARALKEVKVHADL
jgi:MinD superfamily P-loop ATPase